MPSFVDINGVFVIIPNENHVSAKFIEQISVKLSKGNDHKSGEKKLSQRYKTIKIIMSFLCAAYNRSAFKMQFD